VLTGFEAESCKAKRTQSAKLQSAKLHESAKLSGRVSAEPTISRQRRHQESLMVGTGAESSAHAASICEHAQSPAPSVCTQTDRTAALHSSRGR
jgi:hypothetical protein